MLKRSIWAVVAAFVARMAIDFVLHGVLLRATYEATASLWRPADQMNIPLIYVISLLLIVCFVLIYVRLIPRKSLAAGIEFGALYGLAVGLSVGFGPWLHMPIPLTLAWGWFAGGWIKAIAAGAIVGAMVKDEATASVRPIGTA